MFQYNRNLLHLEPESAGPTPVGPGIYWSASLWLVSISSDWTTWYTVADKNVWATTVWHYWDTLTANNVGTFFQWWNNYGFPFSWATTTSSTPALVRGKSWSKPYSSSTFITTTGNTWIDAQIWQSTVNNLWWNGTDTDIARQWPCPSGYHIWTTDELILIYDAYKSIDIDNPRMSSEELMYLLLMPNGWLLKKSDGTYDWHTYYWTSEYVWGEEKSIVILPSGTYSTSLTTVNMAVAYGFSVRPMKNTPVTPDSTWTLIWNGY